MYRKVLLIPLLVAVLGFGPTGAEAQTLFAWPDVISGETPVGVDYAFPNTPGGIGPVGSKSSDLVLWRSGTKLYANRYENGVALWATPGLVAEFRSTPGAYAAASVQGRDYVVWDDGGVIYGRTFGYAGGGSPTVALSPSSHRSVKPRVSGAFVDNTYRWLVVWQRDLGAGSTPDIWAARVKESGGPFIIGRTTQTLGADAVSQGSQSITSGVEVGPSFAYYESSSYASMEPDVACNGEGSCLVAFVRDSGSGVSTVSVARHNLPYETQRVGTPVSVKRAILIGGGWGPFKKPRIARPAGSTDFVVGHISGEKIYLDRVRAAGSNGDLGVDVLGSITELSAPKVKNLDLAAGYADYVVGYRSERGAGGEGYNVGYVRAAIFPSLSATTPSRLISHSTTSVDAGESISVSQYSVGVEAALLWDEMQLVLGVAPRVSGTFFRPGRNLPTQVVRRSLATPLNSNGGAKMASDGNGSTLVVWLDNARAEFGKSYVMAVMVDAQRRPLHAPRVVSEVPAYVSSVDVAWNGEHYMIVWVHGTGGCSDDELLGRSVTAAGALNGSVIPISYGCINSPTVVGLRKQFHVAWGEGENWYGTDLNWNWHVYWPSHRFRWAEGGGDIDLAAVPLGNDQWTLLLATSRPTAGTRTYARQPGGTIVAGSSAPIFNARFFGNGSEIYLIGSENPYYYLRTYPVSSNGVLGQGFALSERSYWPVSVAWDGRTYTVVTVAYDQFDSVVSALVLRPGGSLFQNRGVFEIARASLDEFHLGGVANDGNSELILYSRKDEANARVVSALRSVKRLEEGVPCSDDAECLSGVCSGANNVCL